MTEKPLADSDRDGANLEQTIGRKVERKLKAKRNPAPGIWMGLGTMGLIGWSVVVPTMLGTALGIWLDQRNPSRHSWTLMLLFIGLIAGCLNAWHWVGQENIDIHAEQEDDDA